MNKYKVTVNGAAYEVEIEAMGQGDGPVISAPRTSERPVQSVQTPQAPPQATAAPKKAAGAKDVLAPMQGKIISVNVGAGQNVTSGDIIAVLEAMKMENEIIAVEDATITSVNVTAGQSVEAGDSIVSLG